MALTASINTSFYKMIIYNITAVVEPSQLNSWQAFAPSLKTVKSNFLLPSNIVRYAPSNEAPSSIQCTTSSQERLLPFLEAHAKGFDQMVADASAIKYCSSKRP